MKKYKIELDSLILYNGMDEEFITLLPHYLNAYKSWQASLSGYTIEEISNLSSAYAEYESGNKEILKMREQLESMDDGVSKEKLSLEIETKQKDLTDFVIKATRDNKSVIMSEAGLNENQLKRVDAKRSEYKDIRKKMLGIIAKGLLKLDFETPAVKYDDLLKWRSGEQEVLIADVAQDPENGIPLGFTLQLQKITPILPSTLNSNLLQDTPKSSQISTDGVNQKE